MTKLRQVGCLHVPSYSVSIVSAEKFEEIEEKCNVNSKQFVWKYPDFTYRTAINTIAISDNMAFCAIVLFQFSTNSIKIEKTIVVNDQHSPRGIYTFEIEIFKVQSIQFEVVL